ncbi:helix-turn-helix transcriptional regulator [Streptomyces sp. NPDC048629]|uniref:helix-turn-helix domain-containing protein n=1 Tax=Streptomyces sp. NPDC048629 TaxID=3154824 RepID=UPI0034341A7C
MGRQENAVAATTRQAEALAQWLRAQRRRSGLTYAAMASKVGYEFTASMFSRGASGRAVPSRRLVTAYARACDADESDALKLWKAARKAAEGQLRGTGKAEEFEDLADSIDRHLSHPHFIETLDQLRRAMIQLRATEGQPSLGYLQDRAGRCGDGRHRLPKSSLSVVLRGAAVPQRAHITAFTQALGLSAQRVAMWEQAWDRVMQRHPRAPAARHHNRRLTADRTETFLVNPPTAQAETPRGRIIVRSVMQDATELVLEGDALDRPLVGGPQRPNPPKGYTARGLPIRSPRRYRLPKHRGPRFTVSRHGTGGAADDLS